MHTLRSSRAPLVALALSVPLAALAPANPPGGQPPAPRNDLVSAGATGDGRADCTAIFQRLLDATGKAGGGTVEVPAGRFRIDGHLVIPANVTLRGTFTTPPTIGPGSLGAPGGSVLLAREGRGSTDAPAFLRLAGNNSAVAGLTVSYPEWKQSDVPPVPYPPCISSSETENVGILECLLVNPYEAIRLSAAHRHLVRNVTGYPSRRGLHVDMCGDIGRVENVHFWPFGLRYKPDDPYCEWINTQGVAFEFARTDWEYVLNTFCFGYGVGYRFTESKHGCANGNFLGLGADCCERALLVEQAQGPGLLITNGEFVGRWGATSAVGVEIRPGVRGKVSLVNCSFWGPLDRCVWMRAREGQFTAGTCHFLNWDSGGDDSPAIQVDAGRAIVQGCTFQQENPHVAIGEDVASAILVGNQAEGGLRVENRAGPRTQTSCNEIDPAGWTDAAKLHYRIAVGSPGDGRYLKGWHGRESGPPPYRWSEDRSRLTLPAPADKPCTLTLELNVPPLALGPGTGLFSGETPLAPLPPDGRLVAHLPPTREECYQLELRCVGWIPRDHNPASSDPRTLGVQLRSITLRAADVADPPFDANPARPTVDPNTP